MYPNSTGNRQLENNSFGDVKHLANVLIIPTQHLLLRNITAGKFFIEPESDKL